MAETFTAYYPAVAFTVAKNMAAILNSDAAEILKIRRIGIINCQTAAVAGVLCQLDVRAFFAGGVGLAAPTAVVPVMHDSTNTLPATATYGYAGVLSGTPETLRRTCWSSDEPAVSGATVDELECLIPMNILFDAGYGDANVQPLTLRQDEMVSVYNVAGAAGLLDTWIEFTKE
jgi:hypothetical protein